jgi:hypothetical protein
VIFRRSITWEALDWARFFQAGGVLDVATWLRATPASRASCLLARQALQDGFGGAQAVEAPSAPPDGARAALVELAQAMAARGPGEVRA